MRRLLPFMLGLTAVVGMLAIGGLALYGTFDAAWLNGYGLDAAVAVLAMIACGCVLISAKSRQRHPIASLAGGLLCAQSDC